MSSTPISYRPYQNSAHPQANNRPVPPPRRAVPPVPGRDAQQHRYSPNPAPQRPLPLPASRALAYSPPLPPRRISPQAPPRTPPPIPLNKPPVNNAPPLRKVPTPPPRALQQTKPAVAPAPLDIKQILATKYTIQNVAITSATVSKEANKRDGMLLDFLNPTIEFSNQMQRSKDVLEKMLALPSNQLEKDIREFNKKNGTNLSVQDLKDILAIVKKASISADRLNIELHQTVRQYCKSNPYVFSDELTAALVNKFSSHVDHLFEPFYEALSSQAFERVKHYFRSPLAAQLNQSNGALPDQDLIQINNALLRYFTIIPELGKNVPKAKQIVDNCVIQLSAKSAQANVIRAKSEYHAKLEELKSKKRIGHSCFPLIQSLLANYKSSIVRTPSSLEADSSSQLICKKFSAKLLNQLVNKGISHLVYAQADMANWNLVGLHVYYSHAAKQGLNSKQIKELNRKIQKHINVRINLIESYSRVKDTPITGETKSMYDALLAIRGKDLI